MSIAINTGEYFGPYLQDSSVTPVILARSADLLTRVNYVYGLAHLAGCELPDNPSTGSGVSGSGHGGFRSPLCTVGAINSLHRTGEAVDRYDPSRKFASWCMAHQDILVDQGLWMESPQWTVSWVHLQSQPPRSGLRVYRPSMDEAVAALPKEWT
jgi:hypothetical protein